MFRLHLYYIGNIRAITLEKERTRNESAKRENKINWKVLNHVIIGSETTISVLP